MDQPRNFREFTRRISFYFHEIDFILFATMVAISLFGVVNMYGISGSVHELVPKQLLIVVIAICVMTFFSFINYRYLKNYSFPVVFSYVVSILLLLLTFYSRSIRGVNSWIILGNYTFEPVELAKLVLIILLAKFFSQRHIHINDIKNIIISGIYFGIPAAIIILQPDLGSAIIFSLIWLSMLMASGISKKHFIILVIAGLIVSGFGWNFVLKDYQKTRVISFLNPYKDPRGAGYNLIQSKIAIGTGYWFGNGLGNGAQVKLGFLPEPKNDFVFAATIEQFGLVGMSLVLATILLMLSRIVNIGKRSNNNFGRLFSIGLAVFIFAHVFVGASVNIGLMPATGIPFPFLSYGGSNLISIAIGLGVMQNIKRNS
ncbi:MAG: hypothetical protein A2568_00355 [Candidatus Yanofskybacteria bacterium RIFOXYD1_FULL_44_17]|nr:MAG: hypothetical protein A2207_02530 [Candidatus Yanofskybacteria bacterium RIFOXYA1_FULL_44_17]OGN36704.1 MAG: hypothetical protein A2241_02850 [Candidatus Yanofskybacteria bacterium RIFOXYA2_FULL_45_28]OGN38232.1 MAG: hypothetical protein A2371_02310 [Candidatus Yanofskybacteria bacterium RIFOXYB1_FULL_44_29]OGN39018.1 MAG: hypothetical protein A2302_01745 [Candidatus Yanofskybacteria bacterium RIFOXYB2_FULL_44_18]OGN39211.1 MAG: hypothetical protein A2405_02840 [Candidatus Yanofskybacter